MTTDSATTEPGKTISELVLDYLHSHPHTGAQPEPGELRVEKVLFLGTRILGPIPTVICLHADLLDNLPLSVFALRFTAGELIMSTRYDGTTTTLRWRPVCIDTEDDRGGILFRRIPAEQAGQVQRTAAATTTILQVTASPGDVSI